MFSKSIKSRIFRNLVLFSFVACTSTSLVLSWLFFSDEEKGLKATMLQLGGYLQLGYEHYGTSGLEELGAISLQDRITLVAKDGTVIYDNRVSKELLENHNNREEISEARSKHVSFIVRMSDTLSMQTCYYAMLLKDGRVLRLSREMNSLYYTLVKTLTEMLGIMFLMVLIFVVCSRLITNKIVKPINALVLDGDKSLPPAPYEELEPLFKRISAQNNSIKQQLQDLKRSKQTINTVLDNMLEGLMLIAADGHSIVTSNNICDRLMRQLQLVNEEGNSLTLPRDSELSRTLYRVLAEKGNSSVIYSVRNRAYRFLFNSLERVGGVIVTILDVTETVEREQLRREFSSNVSHELKTPLTSISGFAEIIANGLAQPDDIKHFANNIYKQARRLLNLISDIIHLSEVEEGQGPLFSSEQVQKFDLLSLSKDTADYLENELARRNITLEFTPDCALAEMYGIMRIIEECIYNLTDNAIKYNHEGGHIWLTVKPIENNCVTFIVKDDGIGVPYDEQDRIFERFYRVDKARSCQTGGTGLGLSIVKHGIAVHGGTITLDSDEGHGSTFTVVLPIRCAAITKN